MEIAGWEKYGGKSQSVFTPCQMVLNKLVENTQIHFSLKSLIYGNVLDHPGAACKQGWLFEELLTSLPWNWNTQFCDSRLNENCCAMTGLTDVCYLAELSAKRIYCVFMLYFCGKCSCKCFSICLPSFCLCVIWQMNSFFKLILHLHFAQSIINPIASFLYSILMP